MLTDLGDTCTDIGKGVITNEVECKNIVEDLSKTYISTRDTRIYPTGCFIYNNNIGYLNTYEGGAGHAQVNAICKGGKLISVTNHLRGDF